MTQDAVFVYGTLRQGESNHFLIDGKYRNMERGSLAGALYDLPYGYPAVVVENLQEPASGRVYGEIYTFSNVQKMLKLLDRLEGYNGPNQQNEYERILLPVRTVSGEQVECFVYVQSNEQIQELKGLAKRILSGDWVKDRYYR